MNVVTEGVLKPGTAGILLAIFSVLWVFLGWLWGRKAKGLEEFMLAGRRVGLALGTATAMATWVTSNTTMMAPPIGLSNGDLGDDRIHLRFGGTFTFRTHGRPNPKVNAGRFYLR